MYLPTASARVSRALPAHTIRCLSSLSGERFLNNPESYLQLPLPTGATFLKYAGLTERNFNLKHSAAHQIRAQLEIPRAPADGSENLLERFYRDGDGDRLRGRRRGGLREGERLVIILEYQCVIHRGSLSRLGLKMD